MIQRGGPVVLQMLAKVQQATIMPIIETAIPPDTPVRTDEYNIYAHLPAWRLPAQDSLPCPWRSFWSLLRFGTSWDELCLEQRRQDVRCASTSGIGQGIHFVINARYYERLYANKIFVAAGFERHAAVRSFQAGCASPINRL
jgi:hypothetical protein